MRGQAEVIGWKSISWIQLERKTDLTTKEDFGK